MEEILRNQAIPLRTESEKVKLFLTIGLLVGEHQFGEGDELDPCEVLYGEVVEETDGAGKDTDEKTECPLEEDVLEDGGPPAASPVLVEEVILDHPNLIKIQFLCQTIILQKRGYGEIKEEEERSEVVVLVVEALDGAWVGANDGHLGGAVGGVAAEIDGVEMLQERLPKCLPLLPLFVRLLSGSHGCHDGACERERGNAAVERSGNGIPWEGVGGRREGSDASFGNTSRCNDRSIYITAVMVTFDW